MDSLPYENPEDMLKVDSSYTDLCEFIKSVLHRDFQREVDIRIQSLSSMLDDPQIKYTGRHYDLFRGGKRALLEMREIFNDIKIGIEDAMEDENEV